ncbi:MAG: hypothetical protein EAY75_02960 [Bacteroidetes bacterium]|nr:MAG: hypothetical protein EAY75_02960 [Bacteroidota bacterium]
MNTLLIIQELIGRLHPLVVHLPIGILLLAIVFYFLSLRTKYDMLKPAVKIALLLGSVSAAISCISGFLLSQSGDYDAVLVDRHQWLGIATFVSAAIGYWLCGKNPSYLKIAMPIMGLLLMVTGHLGGSLTHGEGYLTNAIFGNKQPTPAQNKPIANVQQVLVYADIIQPILQSKCYSCHSANKQKGNLRLDIPSAILKGGEHARAVVFGDVAQSEISRRIFLPTGNKERMPPSQKPQLTAGEVELINWWISSGAGFDKKTAQVQQSEKIKPHLLALEQNNSTALAERTLIPEKEVELVPNATLQQLRLLNVAVNTVAQNSNYLALNFVAVDSITPQHISLLQAVRQQIVSLKLGHIHLNDSLLKTVGKLPALSALFLNYSNITDRELIYLSSLSTLQYLNLSNTAVTLKGLDQLKGLQNLKRLYIYRSGITAQDVVNLKVRFPLAHIDSGGYKIMPLPADTIIATATTKK